jgi:hypothetical protein
LVLTRQIADGRFHMKDQRHATKALLRDIIDTMFITECRKRGVMSSLCRLSQSLSNRTVGVTGKKKKIKTSLVAVLCQVAV